MTEQEFRDALKRQVGQTGLSSDRQYQVLAGMKGGESKVRTWNKTKIALVLAVLVVLGMTGAVAGGWDLVGWNGTSLQAQQVNSDRRTLELMDRYSGGQAVSVLKWNEEAGVYRGVLASEMRVQASSLEKLRSWVTDDGTLPWPVNLHEADYRMSLGEARYKCSAEGELRLRKQEVTEDGYIVSCFQLPNDQRFMNGYTIYLRDAGGQELMIWLNLGKKQEKHGFPVEDGSSFRELKVEGMLQAIAIESAAQTRVALCQEMQPALTYKVAEGLPDGVVNESLMAYDCLIIEIIGQGTPDDLLSIFGLTAK